MKTNTTILTGLLTSLSLTTNSLADDNTLEQALADTLDYLLALRKGVEELMDNGGTLSDVSRVDPSRFKKLIGYEMLIGRNAHQLFQEMEWQ